MAEQQQQQQADEPRENDIEDEYHQRRHRARMAAIVTSGESELDSSDDEMAFKYGDMANPQIDDLYSENLDEEDEAWVYRHMRGGVEETVMLKKPNSSKLEQAKLLKPRNSDAVLSCPCCFAIVCMDCQQHEKYENQYRAMFVMNIGVDWNHELIHCDKSHALIDKPPTPDNHVPDPDDTKEQVYYYVYCAACKTQVAALDMQEEVYHFYGTIASA